MGAEWVNTLLLAVNASLLAIIGFTIKAVLTRLEAHIEADTKLHLEFMGRISKLEGQQGDTS